VGLERGSLSLVSTNEELLGRNSRGSGLESRRKDHPQKLALTSPKSGGRSVGVGSSRTQATEFLVLVDWRMLGSWREVQKGGSDVRIA
jgi:hypothetical protein